MKFKAVIFDLDYTLYDESIFLLKAIKKTKIFKEKSDIQSLNINYNFRIKSKNIFKDILESKGLDNKDNLEKLFETCIKSKIKIYLYKNIRNLLNKLKEKKIKIGLLTNGNKKIQENKIKQLNVKNLFDCVIFANKIGFQKPHKNSFLHILRKLNAKTNETLFVGDNKNTDIKGARALGMKTFWINHLSTNSPDLKNVVNNPNLAAQKILKLIK